MRMMFGSARRIEPSAEEKVSHALGFTWIWLTPGSRYSTGSSTVTMCRSTLFTMFNVAYSVVDLPEPVGPVTRIAPYGFLKDRWYDRNESCWKPSSDSWGIALLLSRLRRNTFSAWTGGS